MANHSFQTMPIDDLWALHEEITTLLAAKLTREKRELERRLAQLHSNGSSPDGRSKTARRPYPKVIPKYQNPAEPTETWSGRGRQPRWVSAQLASGKTLDDFTIA